MANPTSSLKQQAHELIDHLPEAATWRDPAYRTAVRADIEAGLADSRAGRVTPVEEILKEFGLDEV